MNHFILQKPLHPARGFTLIEMLVAVFIFSLALVSLATIASRGVIASATAVNRTTAQFLAQEGIEVVEARRDDNFLNLTAPWLSGLSNCFNQWCQVNAYDASGLVFTVCGGGGFSECGFLDRTALGLYGHSLTSGTPTRFRRGVMILGDDASEDVTVISRVEWERNNVTFSSEARKTLFHWFQAAP